MNSPYYTDLSFSEILKRLPRGLRLSYSGRWIYCPQSAVFTSLLTDLQNSENWDAYNLEGTYAHRVVEIALLERIDPIDFVGETMKCEIDPDTFLARHHKFKVTPDMGSYCSDYYNFVLQTADENEGEIIVEESVETSVAGKKLGGTPDVQIVGHRLIHTIDFKYGRWKVNVEDHRGPNKQTAGYNFCRQEMLGQCLDVKTTIYQPRVGYDPVASSFVLEGPKFHSEASELFTNAVRRVINSVERPMYYVHNDFCKWCPGLMYCRAIQSEFEMFEHRLNKDLNEISPQLLSERLRIAGAVEEYCKELKRHGKDRIIVEDEKVPGFHVIRKTRHSYKWKNEKKVEEDLDLLLGDEAYVETKKKLISPNQAKGKGLSKYVQKNTIRVEAGVSYDLVQYNGSVQGAKKQFADLLTEDDDTKIFEGL